MSKVSDIKTCPICGLNLDELAILTNFSNWLSVSCTNCGMFVISRLEFPDFNMNNRDGLNLKKLAFYLKDHPLKAKSEKDKISKEELKELEKKSTFPLSLKESIDEIIKFLKIEKPEKFELNTVNMFLFGIDSESDLNLLVKYSEKKELLHFANQSFDSLYGYVSLDINGVDRGEELLSITLRKGKVFVAIWFDNDMDPIYYKTIKPAVKACGFEAFRIDEKEHNNKIDDEIIKEIENCEFMIADFTGHRGGVYFEAGYAKALKKTVIFTCKSTDSEEVHFDTNHFNHIFWENEEDLKERLIKRIENSIKR